LGAGEKFDVSSKSEFVETIICNFSFYFLSFIQQKKKKKKKKRQLELP